jgi:hypothetical protein
LRQETFKGVGDGIGVEGHIGAAGIEEGRCGTGDKEEGSQDERNGRFCAVISTGKKLPHIVEKLDVVFLLVVGIILPCRYHGSSS